MSITRGNLTLHICHKTPIDQTCCSFNLQTRILVTHGITYLPHVDIIAVISNGTISEVGKYEELMARNGHFADFIHNYGEEESIEDNSLTEGSYFYD